MWFAGYDEAEALFSQTPREWWDVYSDWKQGLEPMSALPVEWHEPAIEALKTLPDTADVLDLVRSAMRIKRARDQAADHIAAGNCPKCGTTGHFIRAALCCPIHGAYAGI